MALLAAIRHQTSVRRKKARRLFRVVAPAIIKFRRTRITMHGGLLHVLELGAVLKRSDVSTGAKIPRRSGRIVRNR